MNDFWQWWQHLPSKIDPVLLSLGHFKLHWYGLMYIVAFVVVYLLIRHRVNTETVDYNMDIVERFFTWAIIGVLVGGRLGYVLFYNAGYYLANPLEVVLPFSAQNGGLRFTGFSGMSYHGGMLGVAIAFVLFTRKYHVNFFKFTDLVIPAIPLGFMFGRIGCFINGTLYGRATEVSWGMYFPLDSAGLLRHPSQLYEALFEGLILFIILWVLRKKQFTENAMAALYLMGYGIFRFAIEFFRQPDAQLGTVVSLFTMGQVLSFSMVATGIAMLLFRRRQRAQLAAKIS